MGQRWTKLLHDSRGATAVEYGIIVAVIVVVALVGIQAVGGRNTLIWSNVSGSYPTITP